MSDSKSKGLRELAHRYYTGELSYESYRSERTSLLDRLTQQSAYQMSTSKTQPMLKKTRVMPVSSSRRHRLLWILIMIMAVIAVLIWLMKAEWITFSLAEMTHEVTATSVTGHDIKR